MDWVGLKGPADWILLESKDVSSEDDAGDQKVGGMMQRNWLQGVVGDE